MDSLLDERRDVRYCSRDGRSLSLDLYLPDASDPVPVLAFAHGGAYVEGVKGGPDRPFLRALGKRGIACIDFEYRLCRDGTFPAPLTDATAALEWTRANADRHGFDPDRIFVGGVSAGAHLATFLPVCADVDDQFPAFDGLPGNRVAGVVGVSGIYDLPAYCDRDIERTRFDAVASFVRTR